ncbi:MAG: PAS domain S-box protein [Deltaproteobacteria bacterium]|nr:PAS domain S-box protein [Deltaproteobacteria bacterium]
MLKKRIAELEGLLLDTSTETAVGRHDRLQVGGAQSGNGGNGMSKLEYEDELLFEAERTSLSGTLVWDPRTNHMEWSPELYRILEYDPEKDTPSVGNCYRRLHQEDSERVKALIAKAMLSGNSPTIAGRLIMPDGRVKHCLMSGYTTSDAQGYPIKLFGSLLDITHQQKTRLRIELQDSRIRKAQKMSRLGFLEMELQTNQVTISEELAKILGWGEGEIKEALETFKSRFSADEQKWLSDILAGFIAGTQTELSFQREFTNRNGTNVHLKGEAELEYDSEGRPGSIFCVAQDITELKSVRQELLESEERFRAIAETLPYAVCVNRLESGEIIFANKGFEQFLEITGDLSDFRIMDIYQDPEDRNMLLTEYEKHGRFGPMEIRCRTATGKSFWAMITGKKLLLGDEPCSIISFVDVTERHKAEEKARSGQHLLREVLDSIPYPVNYRDKELNYILANQAFCEFHGITQDDLLLGDPPTLKDTPEGQEILRELRQVVQEGKSIRGSQTRLRDHSGKENWLQHQRIPIYDSAGELEGVVSISVDITGIRRAQDELQQSRTLLENFLDAIPFQLLLKDLKGRFVQVNQALADHHGMSKTEMTGKLFSDLPGRTEEEQQLIEDADRKVLETGEKVEIPDFLAHLPDGSTQWQHQIKVPMRDHSGDITGLVTSISDITQRKVAENSLRENEHMLRTLLDTIPHPLLLKDREGKYLVVNQSTAELYGKRMEELVGKTFSDTSERPEEEVRIITQYDRQVFETGKRLDVENFTSTVGPGRQIIEKLTKVPLFDNQGQVTGLLTLAQDVTRERKAREELERSEHRFRSLIEDSFQGVMIHKELKLRFANQALAEIFGYENPDDLRSLNTMDLLISPEDRDMVRERGDAREAGEDVQRMYDVRGMKKDGSQFWCTILSQLMDWEGERCILTTFVDIDEKKRMEAQLSAGEQRFRALIEGSVQGIAIHRGFKPMFVNSSFARIFGYSETAELMKMESIGGLFNPEDIARMEHAFQESARTGEPMALIDLARGIRADGNEIRVEIFSTSMDWDGEKAVQIALMDVTDQVQLEAQLRQAQKMEAIGQLAGGVAHDINNTLQIVRMTAENLLDTDLAPRVRKRLESALESVTNSSALTRQLLAFGRRQVLRKEVLDINKVLSTQARLLRRLIGEDIELTVEVSDATCHIRADRGMLEQTILNLCVNARDAMPEGGQLAISVERFEADHDFCRTREGLVPGDFVKLSFQDTGMGMNEDVKERLFEPFFTTKGPEKGSGLGLAMVYGTIQQHNGHIEVESIPGEGSTFFIYLPSTDAQTSAGEEAKPVMAQRGKGETLLVAEDEEELLLNLTEILELKGYKILSARDGVQAMEILQKEKNIDMLVLDVVMPGLGGQKIYEAVKDERPHLPVIFSSGYTDMSLDKATLDDPRVRLIQKPYTVNSLLTTIADMLNKKNG